MTLYRIEYMDDPEAEGACMSCNEDGVKYVPVTIDPEDVIEDWLIDHGVDKENAYNIGHHLTHSVLYSVARAVKCAVLDAELGGDE